jgi:predicted GNAT family N-acyltransferase
MTRRPEPAAAAPLHPVRTTDPATGLSIQLGRWDDLGVAAAAIRRAVFVDEQKVPPHLELDAHDARALHALASEPGGRAIGTGRLLADGHIGRVAVLRPQRGRGVGAALMRALMAAARERGHQQVVLSAQTHAEEFYRRLGFVAEGGIYDDAGLPHRLMRAPL